VTRTRRLLTASTLALLASLTGCMTHEHRVGAGPAGVGRAEHRQYYLFFGLMRLNEVDAQRELLGRPSFAVTTCFGFSDFILSGLLWPLTVCTRSVTVDW
jgi:hypothetical protein